MHMQQRVRSTLPVHWGAPRHHKAHVFIKSQCSGVLLIDVKGQRRTFRHGPLPRMIKKHLADAKAETFRLHKQHFYLRPVAAHKTHRTGRIRVEYIWAERFWAEIIWPGRLVFLCFHLRSIA